MLATTKMSTKGQIVIPEMVRKTLGLISGVEFIIITENDAIILKQIHLPQKSHIKSLLDKANAKAKEAGISEAEIFNEIKKIKKSIKR